MQRAKKKQYFMRLSQKTPTPHQPEETGRGEPREEPPH